MFKNPKNEQIWLALKSLFFDTFFQTSAIRSQDEILTWNQLSVILYFPKFHMEKAAFWYLNPFESYSILKNGLILNIFFCPSKEMTLQSISYSTYKERRYEFQIFLAMHYFYSGGAAVRAQISVMTKFAASTKCMPLLAWHTKTMGLTFSCFIKGVKVARISSLWMALIFPWFISVSQW